MVQPIELDQRQARRLLRGQPDLQPGRRGRPSGQTPGRDDRAAPLRRPRRQDPRAGRALRTHLCRATPTTGSARRPCPAQGEDDATLLRDSYARTVAVAGRNAAGRADPAAAPPLGQIQLGLVRRRSGGRVRATRWRRARARCGRAGRRSVRETTKSSTRRPSRASAWARMPDGPGSTSRRRERGHEPLQLADEGASLAA